MVERMEVQLIARDGVSSVFQKVSSSAKTMGQAITDAGKSGAGMRTLAQQIGDVEQEITTVGTSLVGFGAAGVAGFGMAVRSSTQFHAAMANVNSIARLTEEEMSSLEASVLSMASQFGAVPTDLADALYDITSSGFEANEALEILEASTVAAGAGLTSTATATKAVTAVLNAYGLAAEESGNISDVLFKTVDSGVLTFEELAENLGRVLPAAAALNVSIEELGTAFSELTLQGISAAQAETSIAALMRSAIAPTAAMTDAIEAYGYASAEALINSEGLAGFLVFLAQASGGTSAGLLELVGSAEAVNAAMVLTANGGADFATSLTEMEAAASDGAYALDVFGIQMDTTAGAMKRLSAETSVAAITIGSALEPIVRTGAEAAGGMVAAFNALPGPVQAATVQIGAFASVAALASGSMLLLIPRIVQYRTAIAALRATSPIIAGLATGVGPLTLAIGALTVASVGLYQIFQNIEESASGVAESVGLLTDEVERLKLAAQPEAAEQVQGIVDAIEAQIELLSGDMADLVANGVVPPGTDYLAISGPGGLADQVKTAGSLMDEFSAHVLETASQISDPRARQAYLDWVNGLMADIEHSVEGTNLDDIINQVLITPASEVPGVMNEATDSVVTGWDRMIERGNNWAELTGANVDDFIGSMRRMREAQELNVIGMEAHSATMDGANAVMEAHRERADELMQQLTELAGVDDPLSRMAFAERASEIANVTTEVTGLQGAFRAAMSEISGGSGEWAGNMAGLANAIVDAGTALDTTFRAIVGNTNAIAQQTQSVADWANELIGVAGTWSEIDNLLSEGRISVEQYNAAQQAQASIAEDNLHIQRDVLAMQAMQAPLIAAQTDALQAQMHVISALPPQQQLVALGWMDATTAGRAMEFQTLAIAAAAGEIPQDSFDSMIRGAATADPLLAAVLEDMGLISQGADGTITVHGLAETAGEFDNLILSIDALTLALGGIPPVRIDADVSAAEEAISGLGDWTMSNWGGGWATGGGGSAVQVPVGADTAPAEAQIASLAENVAPVLIPVTLDMGDTAGSAIAATDTSITVSVVGGELAIGLLTAVENARLAAAGVANVDVGTIGTDTSVANLHSVRDAADSIPAGVTTGTHTSNVETAVAALTSVRDAANAIPGSVTVDVGVIGAGGAVELLNSVANAAYAIPDAVSTTVTTNLVTNNVQTFTRIGDAQRHGGIAGYAHGGVVVELAEAGPEVLRLAGGGVVPVYDRGLYEVPAGSYVSPHNAVGDLGADAFARGSDIGVAFNEGVAQGLDSNADIVTSASVSVIEAAISSAEAAAGIASAAKEMIPVGVYMDYGLAQGLLDGQSSVVNAAVSVVQAAQAAARVQAEDNSWVSPSFYSGNSASFEEWKRLWSSGLTASNWTQFKARGYAHGGVVVELAEAGPEVLHFAGGGTVPVHNRGLYSVPPQTYVSPANANAGVNMGGISVTFSGNFYGSNREELDEWAQQSLLPSIGIALERHDRGMGGRT